jgi:Fic family protein
MAMKEINYKQFETLNIPNEIINMLSAIHEYKGKQELFLKTKPEVLEKLVEIAKIQSTGSSNRIEGINTSDSRFKALMANKAKPQNRAEEEISGYRYVLDTIHNAYENIPITKNVILELHRDLYSFSASRLGGRFKITDNYIEETDEKGNTFVRFQPISAFQTSDYIDDLVNSFKEELGKDIVDPLILIPCFILDFLCIHPFNDGNGRMSRLLTLLLLYQNDYAVGKYISIEMIIEKTKSSYYDSLQDSSVDWHENKNNYLPFIRYMLGVILKAYKDFEDRFNVLLLEKVKPAKRVFDVISNSHSSLSKVDIMNLCPEISKRTIERAIIVLQNDDKIQKVGEGKLTTYALKNYK